MQIEDFVRSLSHEQFKIFLQAIYEAAPTGQVIEERIGKAFLAAATKDLERRRALPSWLGG
jgi:hypothetical protein